MFLHLQLLMIWRLFGRLFTVHGCLANFDGVSQG